MKYVNGLVVKLYNHIISTRWINKNRKTRRRLRAALFHNICYRCRACMGSKNPDRVFYVIRCPQENMRLFAVINYIVYHLKIAEREGYEPVIDWKYYPNKYFSEDENVGKINAWELFFEQPSGIDIDEVYKSKNVEMSAGDWEASAFKEFSDREELLYSHRIFEKYIHLNERMQRQVDEETARVGIDSCQVLAVKIRGTDFITARPEDHSQVLTVEGTSEVIDEKSAEWGGFDRIYLATEDVDILRFMKDKYGAKLFYTDGNAYATTDVGNNWLSEMYGAGSIDKIADMEAYLVTTYVLAKADYLIAPAVGGTLGAMRIKGEYKQIYIAR